ncbi:MAG TPA: alpha/beta hydrolase [Caldimonas sp.]|nr:alpha/beta hydrolase [Caldimonas sp.]HEX2542937.1 alpha/beta hydrolase [Caldimonas sp.]
MTPRILRLPDGRRFEVVEQGRRGGTALLLLHGITDTWRSFEPVLPFLPGEWHVVALTQRGHGGSDAAPGYRTRDFAADAAAVLQALDMAPAVVVGHSMGAANALRLAIDHPACVRGVVAAGAFASFGDKAALIDFVEQDVLTIGDTVPRELADAFQRDTIAGPVAPGLIETMVDECLRTPAATWKGAFAGLLEDDFGAELGRIDVPVLLPWGDADSFVPEEDQRRLQRALPRATRSVFGGAGHALHWEQPDGFAAVLRRFVHALDTETAVVS